MPRALLSSLALALAAVAHVDWHVARPTHHRLSAGWPHHWILGVAAFAAVGWIIARRVTDAPGRAAIVVVVAALVLAQGVEPLLEVAFYERRFGYPVEPERWRALAVFVAAGLPALLLALRLCRPATTRTAASTQSGAQASRV